MCPAGRTPRAALLLLLLVIAHAGNALKCYSCSSETDLRCRDYFDRSYHMVKDCEIDRHGHTNMEPYCKKLVYAVDDHHQHNETIRSCAWASREDSGSICRETLPSYSSHLLHCSICQTEACNGAPGSALAASIACLLPALAATVFKTA